MNIYGILIISIISCLLVVTIKQYKPEFALIVTISAGAVIMILLVSRCSDLIDQLRRIAENSGIKNEYIEIMLKGLAICYITQFSGDICNDFGQTSLASKIELCGKITLAVLCIPLMVSLIEIVTKTVG